MIVMTYVLFKNGQLLPINLNQYIYFDYQTLSCMPKFCPTCGKPLQFENAEICPSCGVRISEPPKPAEEIYATAWDRWIAYVIDFIIGILIFGAVVLLFLLLFGQGNSSQSGSAIGFGILFGFIAFWLYFAYFESSPSQATLGKQALKIKVIDGQGQPISFGHSLLRSLLKIVFTLTPIGLFALINGLVINYSAEKKGIHDHIVNTRVIKVNQ